MILILFAKLNFFITIEIQAIKPPCFQNLLIKSLIQGKQKEAHLIYNITENDIGIRIW